MIPTIPQCNCKTSDLPNQPPFPSPKPGFLSMKGRHPKMLLCNCICAWQPVRVVHGDGHIRRLTPPVTVSALLQCHPHHFVSEPTSTGPLFHTGMLPFDMELEEGRIYLLLPLPRLLPHLASTPACPCFSQCRDPMELGMELGVLTSEDVLKSKLLHPSSGEEGHQAGEFLVVAKNMRKLRQRVSKSKFVKSLMRMSKRMIPERLWFRFSFRKGEKDGSSNSAVTGKSTQYSCSRNRWKPGLECISEVDLLTGLLNNRDSEGNDCR